MRTKVKLVIQKINKKRSDKKKLRNKACFIREEHCVVKELNPHKLIEEPPLLSSNALLHPHWQVDLMGEVVEGFLNVNDPPLSLSHRIKACTPSTTSFSPRIYKDTPLLDFRRSITIFVSPFLFLLLIFSGLFPFIPSR